LRECLRECSADRKQTEENCGCENADFHILSCHVIVADLGPAGDDPTDALVIDVAK
jgi:hypothetical protein